MDRLSEIKKEPRLQILVASSLALQIPVLPVKAVTELTWLQQEVLLEVRHMLTSSKREVPDWYRDQLEHADKSPNIQITDIPSVEITYSVEESTIASQLDPVPRPAAFQSGEWVRES